MLNEIEAYLEPILIYGRRNVLRVEGKTIGAVNCKPWGKCI
jgi:hypothetical protein